MQGFGSTISGALNTVSATDTTKRFDGMAANIMGVGNTSTGSSGTIIIGNGNEINNSYLDLYDMSGRVPSWATGVGDWTTVSAESIKAVGANGELGSVGALGAGNKADYALFSTMTGVGNSITGTATTDYTIKTDNVTNGYGGYSAYNSVSGYRNAVTNSDNTLAIGSYNKISNGNENLVMGNFNELTGTTANGASRNVIFAYNDGDSASTVNPSAGNFDRNAATTLLGTDLKNNFISGTNVSASNGTTNSIAIGTGAVLGGSTAAGTLTTGTAVNAIAIGTGAQALNENTISIGTGNVVSGKNSGAIGDPSYIYAANSYSIGNNNTINAAKSGSEVGMQVLGNSVTADVDNSVYLGNSSRATAGSAIGTAVLNSSGTAGSTTTAGDTGTVTTATVKSSNGTTITYSGFAGATASGVVTVGAAGTERRIQNVAAGEISATSTDAINGSQLYAVAAQVAENKGDITTNATNIANLTNTVAGNTTAINNLTTTVAAAKTEVTSVDGSVVINETTGTDGQSIYDLHVDTGSTTITYKANDSNSQTTSLADGLNFTNGTNTTATVDANGVVTYNLNDDITVNNVTATTVDATTVNGDTITAGDTVTINNNGINMGDTKITNLQAGTISATSTDAVTGAQLYKTNQQVNQNTDSINKLTDRVGDLQDEVQDVGALGAALGALKPIQYDPLEPTQLMAGIGTYRSSSAVALGLAHYKNESTMFHAGVAFNNGSNGHLMANAGVTWKFGYRAHETAVSDRYRNGPISSAYALQDEVSALKDENLNLKERLQAEQQRNAEQDALIQSILSELKALKG